jgi:hypothetical protein
MIGTAYSSDFIASIRKVFTDAGCELLSDYVNRRTKVTYRCSCGNVAEIRFDSFQAGTRCRSCLSQRIKDGMKKSNCVENQKQKNLQQYGVENYFQSQDFKEKAKKTLLEKYGVDNVSKNPEMKVKIKAKLKEANQKKYGVDFLMQSEKFREKAKATCLEKYGVDNFIKLAEFKEKAKQTMIKKYGVENAMLNKEIVLKAKLNSFEACMKKYGVPYIGQVQQIKEKIILSNLQKYGVECTLKVKDIYERTRETLFMRYGVENIGYFSHLPKIREKINNICLERYDTIYPMQNKRVAEQSFKNSFSKKEYKLPSGITLHIQGYENFAFDALVRVYDEGHLINSRDQMPEIWYSMDDGKYRCYYPDIYIPTENTIIEVKSPYTYYILDFKKTDYKRKAVEALGFKFKLLVFNKRGELVKGTI